jgi:hypothetical protein
MTTENIFDFTGHPPPKRRKEVVDDVRNILIVEFAGDKTGELQAKELFEELIERGLKVRIMN